MSWMLDREVDRLDRHGATTVVSDARAVGAIYTRRRERLLAAIDRYLSGAVEVQPSAAGLFVWVRMALPPLDARQVLSEAVRRGVALVPGQRFATGLATAGRHTANRRLSICPVPEDAFDEAARRLADAIHHTATHTGDAHGNR